jgi:large subunit ribosomal protein L21
VRGPDGLVDEHGHEYILPRLRAFDPSPKKHVLLTLGVRWAESAVNANSFVKTSVFKQTCSNKGFLVVYAIVRAGGRQEKVEVGTIVVLDRIKADKDGNIELVPVLHVDGETITHDAKKLANIKVVAEVVGDLRGPKIVIQKFKNKTGYKKRQGHRQELTRVKITSIK